MCRKHPRWLDGLCNPPLSQTLWWPSNQPIARLALSKVLNPNPLHLRAPDRTGSLSVFGNNQHTPLLMLFLAGLAWPVELGPGSCVLCPVSCALFFSCSLHHRFSSDSSGL